MTTVRFGWRVALSVLMAFTSGCGNSPLGVTQYQPPVISQNQQNTGSGFVCTPTVASQAVVSINTLSTIQVSCSSAFVLGAPSGSGSPSFGNPIPIASGGVSFSVSFATAGVQTINVVASAASDPSVTNPISLVFSVQGTGAVGSSGGVIAPLACAAAGTPNIVTIVANDNGTVATTRQSQMFQLNVTANRNAIVQSISSVENPTAFTPGMIPTTPGTTWSVTGNFFTGRAGLFNVKVVVADAVNATQTATCSVAIAVTTTNTDMICTATANGGAAITTAVDQLGTPIAPSSNIAYTITCDNNATLSSVMGPTGFTSGNPVSAGRTVTVTSNLGMSVGPTPVAFTILESANPGRSTVCAVSVTSAPTAPTAVPVMRYFSAQYGDHYLGFNNAGLPDTTWGLEGVAFSLYDKPTTVCSVAVSRCRITSAPTQHFLSADPRCEQQTVEGILGYACLAPISNQTTTTTLLRRVRSSDGKNHLSTIDANDFSAFALHYGPGKYVDETVAFYVPGTFQMTRLLGY